MIIPITCNTEEVIGSYYVNTSESNMLMYSKTFIIFNSYHLGKFNNEKVIQLNTNKIKSCTNKDAHYNVIYNIHLYFHNII